MDRQGTITEAVIEICEADYDGSEAPETFEAKVVEAVETSWRAGISFDTLLIAARRKLGFRDAEMDEAR
jgi:hypothetical protein